MRDEITWNYSRFCRGQFDGKMPANDMLYNIYHGLQRMQEEQGSLIQQKKKSWMQHGLSPCFQGDRAAPKPLSHQDFQWHYPSIILNLQLAVNANLMLPSFRFSFNSGPNNVFYLPFCLKYDQQQQINDASLTVTWLTALSHDWRHCHMIDRTVTWSIKPSHINIIFRY